MVVGVALALMKEGPLDDNVVCVMTGWGVMNPLME